MTKHGYAFLPEEPGRPDRLIRFVNGDSMALARYIEDRNLLYINKSLYDQLNSADQGRALTTHTDLDAMVRDGQVSIKD